MLTNLLLNQAADEKLYVEDVFSTYLYTGNASARTITNGIDLAGKGGMVWTKARSSTYNHALYDTERGTTKSIGTYLAEAETTSTNGITAFNSDGYSIGGNDGNTNLNNGLYASWTFRKAAKFFDVVKYTGTGANRTINHSLGVTPGLILIKKLDATVDWQVYHRSLANTEYLVLNTNAAKASGATRWNSTSPTSTTFSLGTDSSVNANNDPYIAYLFAHDTDASGVIQCGSYTGNGLTSGPEITLGWEPQYVIIKRVETTGTWVVFDNQRGVTFNNTDHYLAFNLNNAESSLDGINILADGFKLNDTNSGINLSGSTYVYLAIRRGPMRVPTDATKVFQPVVYTGTNVDNRLVDTTIAPDMVWIRQRTDSVLNGMAVADRLRGQPYLLTGTTAAEVSDLDSFDAQIVSTTEYGNAFSSMNGVWVGNDATSKLNANTTASNHVALAFKRAPSYFDCVAYSGTGSNRTIAHNLSVAPELILIKQRGATSAWAVYAAAVGNADYLQLHTTDAKTAGSTVWNSTTPTDTVFSLGTSTLVNANAGNYIAYLFATCPSVSKVGSYTGTGSVLQVDCGFTAGARFVMIKRTDSTGDWFVLDTARGIGTGNDPYLAIDSAAAEVTNTDYIDPYSAGFELSSTAPAGLNANGGTYIYLAIA